ncbi:hypothetical protein N7462_000337 [Penicillium macrosclerotiorum]|uniref:uncharacterized protein n=1 Tax=Penicillium macrosclerotiorum TaxID=303699 RepID=UPI002547C170|nr:uncharacterized protein N7462_000337 [Penicillium macrosclerotiorum]KAJ5698332.1 hypothetical protein N7462_000337 [Penicillium macrosclerotiorum]
MARFKYLYRFETEKGEEFFAKGASAEPVIGASVNAYPTFEDLLGDKNVTQATLAKLLPPIPQTNLPIYCVGLNYKSHAKEASVCNQTTTIIMFDLLIKVKQLNVPFNPPLWTKPAASLSAPNESIPISRFCASHLPDYEGELVFVTARDCLNVEPEDASSYILGYTIGNDISCRFFQLPEQSGGQFFYAKAFDKFAPIGPVLVSPYIFNEAKETASLVTRVNGEVKQNTAIHTDMIFSPEQILSWMSQSTTVPAYTVVMTGTPAGVGVFQKPRQLLNNGDVVEIEITALGKLKNEIVFKEGQDSIL